MRLIQTFMMSYGKLKYFGKAYNLSTTYKVLTNVVETFVSAVEGWLQKKAFCLVVKIIPTFTTPLKCCEGTLMYTFKLNSLVLLVAV